MPRTKIYHVLKKELGLSYKMASPMQTNLNSLRSKVYRQQYACQLVKVLQEGHRVMNIDESWLSQTDFCWKSWSLRGKQGGVVRRMLPKRVALITAIDTLGHTYLAISTSNTDTNVIAVFLMQLADILDQ